jgi:Tol biopolymer transport system component
MLPPLGPQIASSFWTTSNRNGTADIYKQPINGSLPEPLAMTSQNESQPRLSPDGREVLYLSVPPNPLPEEVTTIMAVPVEGGQHGEFSTTTEFGIFSVLEPHRPCACMPINAARE